MNKRFWIDALLWGFVLWLVGYVLGILFFAFVPADLLGWAIMPIGILVTLWVLLTRVKGDSLQYYVLLGLAWCAIAIVLDYLLLVQLFKPADGYYKLDVYLYYAITLVLPVVVGWWKSRGRKPA